jgi:hypothetical protein
MSNSDVSKYELAWFMHTSTLHSVADTCLPLDGRICVLLQALLAHRFVAMLPTNLHDYMIQFAQTKTATPNKASTNASTSYEAMKDKRAWDLAISPAKSLPMQAFMLYMSGGGVQIFSMGIVFMLLLSPFKNLASMNNGTLFILFLVSLLDVYGHYSVCAVGTCTSWPEASTGTESSTYASATEDCLFVM